MIDKIQSSAGLNSIWGNNKCKCNSGESGFDIVMASLLKAVADKNKRDYYINQESSQLLQTQNLIQNTNKIESTNKDKNVNERIDAAVAKASKTYGIDENLIRAIIKVESNFNPNTVSKAGAKGLMQLMPENCKEYGVTDPFNIEQNIDAGTRHIRDYIKMFDGDIEMGLMAYNGGPGRMKSRGVKSMADIYKMPKETQNYVPKVMKYYKG